MNSPLCIGLILAVLFQPLVAETPLRLAGVFQDKMVLQRGGEVPVWGWAEPGTEVTVRFGGQTHTAEADPQGAWKVTLTNLAASTEERELRVSAGGKELKCSRVLVGEVWIAAGQSNMNAKGPDKDSGVYPFHESPEPGSSLPPVSLMRYGWGASLEPLPDNRPWDPEDGAWRRWRVTNPSSVGIPEQFARVLRDDLRVPVGIIQVAASGTNQAAWMSRSTLESFPSERHENYYRERLSVHENILSKRKLKTWEGFEAAEAKWIKNPKGHWPGGSTMMNFPTALYNTRIHPLAPFAIRGVIWHQGESGPRGPYGDRLVAMARQWRERFGQDFYFLWGTLGRSTSDSPPLEPKLDSFYRSGTNNSIRGALGRFDGDAKVALVEFYDQGDAGTHWLLKNESGRRMALAALDVAYDRPRNYTGPRKSSVRLENGDALIQFEHVAEGLDYEPSLAGVSGVVVQHGNGPQEWGNVEVVGKDLLKVSHPRGLPVTSVAYGMNRNPHETIFDSDGLPASPFRYKAGRIPSKVTGRQLVEVQGLGRSIGYLNVAHVRRDGYRFQVRRSSRGPEGKSVPAQVFAPQEWEGVEVRIGKETVAFKSTPDSGGHWLSFKVPVNGAWVTVCRPGTAGKFADVDRF